MTQIEMDECICEALLRLMAEKRLDTITISDIVRKAGIGRGTFYRHFQTKEDVIKRYFDLKARNFMNKGQGIPQTKDDYYEILFNVFSMLKENKEVLKLLLKAGLDSFYFSMLLEGIERQSLENGMDTENEMDLFYPSFITGALYGVTMKWIEDDCRQSVKQVCDFFHHYFPFPPGVAK